MRKTVYLPKYFPHLLLFLHSQSFKFPSGVIVLSTKCSHVKRSSEKNAESKRKQWASLLCCWDHTSSGQRRAPLPEALGTCLAVAATAALRLPGGRGGRGEKQQTGLWPSLPDPHSPSCPILGPETESFAGSSVRVVCGSRILSIWGPGQETPGGGNSKLSVSWVVLSSPFLPWCSCHAFLF